MAPVMMTLKDVICDRGSDRKACQHHFITADRLMTHLSNTDVSGVEPTPKDKTNRVVLVFSIEIRKGSGERGSVVG
jgi:hypothetical protein